MQGYDLYIQCNAGIVKSLLFNGGGNGAAAMKSESREQQRRSSRVETLRSKLGVVYIHSPSPS